MIVIFEQEDMRFELPGGLTRYLNLGLVVQQGVTPDRLEKLKATHREMHLCKVEAAYALHIKDRKRARLMASEVERLDGELQRLWGFDPDPRCRIHWCDIDGCKCRRQTYSSPEPYRLVDPTCPYHGVE
jgi:hypothetical protein